MSYGFRRSTTPVISTPSSPLWSRRRAELGVARPGVRLRHPDRHAQELRRAIGRGPRAGYHVSVACSFALFLARLTMPFANSVGQAIPARVPPDATRRRPLYNAGTSRNPATVPTANRVGRDRPLARTSGLRPRRDEQRDAREGADGVLPGCARNVGDRGLPRYIDWPGSARLDEV